MVAAARDQAQLGGDFGQWLAWMPSYRGAALGSLVFQDRAEADQRWRLLRSEKEPGGPKRGSKSERDNDRAYGSNEDHRPDKHERLRQMGVLQALTVAIAPTPVNSPLTAITPATVADVLLTTRQSRTGCRGGLGAV